MEADELMQEILAVHKSMDFSKLFNRIFPFNPTEFQMMKIVLEAEQKHESIISSDIARSLGITRSAVSQMVKKLEDRNILVRETNENDKKSANLRLSQSSRAFYIDVKNEIVKCYTDIVEEIGYDKMVDFLETYLKIANAFSEYYRKHSALGNREETADRPTENT